VIKQCHYGNNNGIPILLGPKNEKLSNENYNPAQGIYQ
jgi:hypothetical protein